MAPDVTLRCPPVAALHLDRKVDMRGSTGVRHWLYSAEVVFPRQAGKESAEALKTLSSAKGLQTSRNLDSTQRTDPDQYTVV